MAAPKRAKPKTKAPARKRAGASSVLTDALAEAAWAEADKALADALMDFAALQSATKAKARADAMLLLGQSLQRAARKRGLAPFGVVGALEAYNPARHAYSGARAPKRVRIVSQGVARGGEVLIKAQAGPARQPRPRERV
jgi:hypothetical protein